MWTWFGNQFVFKKWSKNISLNRNVKREWNNVINYNIITLIAIVKYH